jgi:signal peptidase complex subunit 2
MITRTPFAQSFDELGFPEDHFMSNVKLGLGTLACLLAFVAQFWPNPLKPMPFPESRGLLLVCCVLYFAISFGLQLLATMYEKDSILYTFAPTATSPCYSPGMKGKKLRVGSSLPRFSVDYTLSIEVLDGAGQQVDKAERILKLTDYFEENGTFHEDWFMEDVKDAVVTHVGKRKGE